MIRPSTSRLSSIALVLVFGLISMRAASAYGLAPDAESLARTEPAATMQFAQAQPAPAAPPAAPAANTAQNAGNDEPIGNVATLTGSATVTRNNQSPVPLNLKDDIFLNDVVATSANSKLGVTFNDETTFNLTANASMTIDNYIYEGGGKQNAAIFDVTKGTVAFVASAVAKTGDMKITTPTATLGIRGTSGLVEVNGAGNGAHNIKLYPDPDGHVGTIDVSDRRGTRLGALTQGASGFTVRPGAGGRVTAAPLTISPQQMARDQGIVRQAHASQAVGRQVVREQRAIRRANPNRNNLRNAPGQRQNNLQRPNGPQQPGNRAGQPGQPQQLAPNRAGQESHPPPGAQQPGQQQLHQGGLPKGPAGLPKRPPAPKKPPKEKRR